MRSFVSETYHRRDGLVGPLIRGARASAGGGWMSTLIDGRPLVEINRLIEKFISPLIDICYSDQMNISVEVTGELLEYLNTKVNTGLYKSRSEVIRSAIRDMIQRDLEEQLRSKGLTPKKLKALRKQVAGEIIAKKYKELV